MPSKKHDLIILPNSIQYTKALSLLLFSLLILFVIFYDRTNVIDNQNYVEYFKGNRFDYLLSLIRNEPSFPIILSVLFSEEFLWSAIAELFSFAFIPQLSVYILVVVINSVVFMSIWRMKGSLFALVLWIIIPAGFFVVGFFQLRQGLAFALLLYGAYRNKTLLWALAASLIHTTAVLPSAFYLIYFIFIRHRGYTWQILAASFFAFSIVMMGSYLFDTFGGRRLDEYVTEDGTTSPFYVVGSTLLLAFYLLSFMRSRTSEVYIPEGVISLTGIGVCLFSILSFFLFPLGTQRVGYFMFLFLIPLLSNRKYFHPSAISKPETTLGYLTLVFVIYQSIKSVI